MTTATRPRTKTALAIQARAAEQLQATIALVTAMHNTLESGEPLTPAQLAACFHDHTLGILWTRIEDYCEYVSRSRPLRRIAYDDRSSVAIDLHFRQFYAQVDAWRCRGTGPCAPIVDEVRRAALGAAQ